MLIRIEAAGVEVDEPGTIPAATHEVPPGKRLFVDHLAGAVGEDRFRSGGAVGIGPFYLRRQVCVHVDLLHQRGMCALDCA